MDNQLREKLKELVELYKIRLSAEKAIRKLHGPKVTIGIRFELRNVIADLNNLIKEEEKCAPLTQPIKNA